MESQRIVFTAPGQAELQRFQLDETLEPGEMLVETLRTLISPGTEGAWYSGLQRDVSGDRFQYPIYPGYCHMGQVVRVAPDVTEYQVGDWVVTGAGHASHVKVSAKRPLTFAHSDLRLPIAKVPAGLPPEQAPFAKMAEIAITAVRIAHFSLGDRVLVLGLGMVGNLAAQLFQLAGATVMATDLIPFRLERAKACGIANVVNRAEVDVEEAVMEWTKGRGADVVVESVGLSELILQAIGLTRRLGQVILLGTPRQKATVNPTPAFWKAHMKGVTIVGALRCLFYPLHESPHHRHSVREDLEQVLAWLAEGRLVVGPLHTHTFSPERCQEAYQAILYDKAHCLGVVLDWSRPAPGGENAAAPASP